MPVCAQQGVRLLIGEEWEIWPDLRRWSIVHSRKELANVEPQWIVRWWLVRLLVVVSCVTHDTPEVSGRSEVELGRCVIRKVDPEMSLDFHDDLNEIEAVECAWHLSP